MSAKITDEYQVSSQTVYTMVKSFEKLTQKSGSNRKKRRILNMNCPYLEYLDTGWFTWRYECKVTGQEVGNDHNTTKVDYTCKNDCSNCVIYKRERGL